MSMYGDDSYYHEMEELDYEIEKFLEEHPLSELMEILRRIISRKED